MKDLNTIPGFFGKSPSQADFVCLRLPSGFVRTWENWLQASLRTSQRVLGDAWLDLYLSSHIWRFVLPTNICDEGAWAGVLMPSVDREGHYFPLTIAGQIAPSMAHGKLLDQAMEWFDHLERVALTSLADGFDIAHLDEMLQEVGSIRRWRKTSFRQILSKPFSKTASESSLWQARGQEHLASTVKAFKGLPSPVDFVALMTEHSPLKGSASASPANMSSEDSTQALWHTKDPEPPPNETTFPRLWCSKGATDVGLRRKINEDAYLDMPQAGVWAVADGMGGHSAGDLASQTVVRRLGRITPQNSLTDLERLTQRKLQEVNAELLRLAKEMGPAHVVGTTVVVLLAVGHACVALWAGDSRLYRHRDGCLVQLTEDHSMAAEMAKIPNAMPNGYGDNIVTRALGADPVLEIDRIAFEAQPGDSYLLCSDGLFKEVQPTEIKNILTEGDCAKRVSKLIELALERQARDNVTVIVISAEPAE